MPNYSGVITVPQVYEVVSLKFYTIEKTMIC